MSDRKTEPAGHLRRSLGLWDLILYGIVLISPIAAVPLFGVVQIQSKGHATLVILLSMVAMILTATSYGRMAARFPAAGSAYTFVRHGFNAYAGFMAGWAMLLDYLLVPVICIVYAALTLERLLPGVPNWIWCLVLMAAITAVNLAGVRSTANANLAMMCGAVVVIVPFILLAVHWIWRQHGWPGLFSIDPFYNRETFAWHPIATGAALAALTYGGFDGVSTLAEEVENPQRNILLATVFVCTFTGVFSGLQIYLAQRVHPGFADFANAETAFMDVTRVVGGPWLFSGMAAILLVTNIGSGLTAQAGISRLLYGMGRDGVLPESLFGHISNRTSVPSRNILLVGVLAFAGCLLLDYEKAAELINFGAFLAFMGVNASAARVFYFRVDGQRPRLVRDLALPVFGLLFCLVIWWNLSPMAKIVGGLWFLAGAVYLGYLTRGFRLPMPNVRDGFSA